MQGLYVSDSRFGVQGLVIRRGCYNPIGDRMVGMIPTEPIGSLPRPPALIEAVAQGDSDDPRLDRALRRCDPGHHRAVRSDGLSRHHRWRTAEVSQLLDLLRSRAPQHRSRRLQDSVRGRTHPPHAAADRRAVPLQALRGQLSRGREAIRPPPDQAGGHLAVGPEPHVSGRRHPGLLARAVHRRSAGGARDGDPPLLREGRLQGPDRLHRGPPGDEDRPVRPAPAQFHRSEQPGAVAVLARGAPADRRAHLPWRRSRFDAQRRRRLRRAAAEPVSAEGRQLLHRAGRRARSRARPEDHSPVHEARSPGLRRRHRADRSAHRNAPRKSATGSWKRRSTSRSSNWARPTIADSRRSATTRRRPATRRSRRFARAWRGPRSRPRRSERSD